MTWKSLLKYLLLFYIMVLIGCGQDGSRKQEASPSTALKMKYDLNWDKLGFTDSPARLKIEQCRLLDEFDFLVLYYGLSSKPFDAAEFEDFFPEYKNAVDEFIRRKAADTVVQRLEAVKTKLLSTVLCARIDGLLIGEYDFGRKRFPFLVTRWGNEEEGLQHYAFFKDRSKSAAAILSWINTLASAQGRVYKSIRGTVDFDNMGNTELFPPFIAVQEDIAQRVRPEFGQYEDPLSKEISEALGTEYKGLSTIVAYVIFSPKAAAQGAGMTEGFKYDIKEVHGEASEVVFATPKGTVLAVYPVKVGSASSTPQ